MRPSDFGGPAFAGALRQFRRELAFEVAGLVVERLREELRESQTQAGWLYGRKQAAEYLSVTEDVVKGLERHHGLPVERLPNGRLVYRAADLDAFVRGGAA